MKIDEIRQNAAKLIHRGLKGIGFFFIFLGLLGFILPVIPGIPFLVLGLIILGEESVVSGWIINRLPEPLRAKVKDFLARRKRGAAGGSDDAQ